MTITELCSYYILLYRNWCLDKDFYKPKRYSSAGNWTRVARVTVWNATTIPHPIYETNGLNKGFINWQAHVYCLQVILPFLNSKKTTLQQMNCRRTSAKPVWATLVIREDKTSWFSCSWNQKHIIQQLDDRIWCDANHQIYHHGGIHDVSLLVEAKEFFDVVGVVVCLAIADGAFGGPWWGFGFWFLLFAFSFYVALKLTALDSLRRILGVVVFSTWK